MKDLQRQVCRLSALYESFVPSGGSDSSPSPSPSVRPTGPPIRRRSTVNFEFEELKRERSTSPGTSTCRYLLSAGSSNTKLRVPRHFILGLTQRQVERRKHAFRSFHTRDLAEEPEDQSSSFAEQQLSPMVENQPERSSSSSRKSIAEKDDEWFTTDNPINRASSMMAWHHSGPRSTDVQPQVSDFRHEEVPKNRKEEDAE